MPPNSDLTEHSRAGGPAIVLASASPRRHSLLSAAGLRFSIEPSHVDESFDPGLNPEVASELLAERKARAAAAHHAGQQIWVIGSDTLVALPLTSSAGSVDEQALAAGSPKPSGAGYRYLGKPENEHEARQFLRWLSGSRHRVVTGVAVWRCSDGRVFVGHAETAVSMRTLSTPELEAYVASGEWRDKAGGYAIQASADAFVTRLEGDFDTVVGLPLGLTLRLLAEAGAPLPRELRR